MTSLLGKVIQAAKSGAADTQPPVAYSRSGISSTSFMQGGSTDVSAYMRAYGSSGTVHAIVSMLARQTAKKAWHLYRQQPVDGRRRYTTGDKGSDQRTEVIKHQAIALWNKPNSWTTGFQFREMGQTYLDLTGEDYIVIGRNARASVPLSLWQVRPDRMDPVPSADDYLAGYIYTGPSGEQIPLQVNEVIQVKYPNPFDPYHGLGPIQSILVDIDAAKYSAQWNRNFFLNSATPGGVIQVDKRLTDEEWNEFTNRWRETHRGVGAAHRVAVLEQGAQWVQNSHSMRDMDFAGLRNISRDVIREAFAMHKAIMGTTDDVNRANAETAREQFESFQITDRLDRWKDVLNCFYLPLFGTTGDGVEMDYDDPVQSNREADALELNSKASAAKSLVDAGYDPHDVLETVGLPDMDVVEKAEQTPALLPGWTSPAAPAEPGTPAQGGDGAPDGSDADSQNRQPARIAARAIRAAAPSAPDHDLSDVDRQWKEALAVLVAAWLATIVPGLIQQLRDQVYDLVDDDDLDGLTTLSVDTDDGADLLATAMYGMASTAADQAAREATAQGTTVDPQPADRDRLRRIAIALAALQGAAMALSAGSEATRVAGGGNADADDVAAQVEAFLKDLSDASLTSKLAGALSAAQNESRIATFLAGPSVDLFASEVNDKATCKACREIDGTYIGNSRDENIVNAIDALYPNGGYIGCAGGDRCRGTIIADYLSDNGGENQNDLGPYANHMPAVAASKDAAAKVFELASLRFPPEAMAWMHHASWTGPAKVPLEHIDFDPDEMSLNGRDDDQVQTFAEQLRAGKKLKPVILVKAPGSDLLQLPDGHHRYLAAAQEGKPLRAYIGTVDTEHGDWETMHLHQFMDDSAPGPSKKTSARLPFFLVDAQRRKPAKTNGYHHTKAGVSQ